MNEIHALARECIFFPLKVCLRLVTCRVLVFTVCNFLAVRRKSSEWFAVQKAGDVLKEEQPPPPPGTRGSILQTNCYECGF